PGDDPIRANTADDDDVPVRQRDRSRLRERARQGPDAPHRHPRRRAPWLVTLSYKPGGREEVEPVRLVQVAGARARDAGMAVLPDDPVRLRVDHDHAVVPIV